MPSQILTITHKRDHHALLVRFALESLGVVNHFLYTDDLVQKHKSSFLVGEVCDQRISRGESSFDPSGCDTIWLRRIRSPEIPVNDVDPRDLENVRSISQSYLGNVLHCLGHRARWINPIDAMYRAESKIRQLILANELGLIIPDTLISNDPSEIHKFVAKEDVVSKSLVPLYWREDNNVFFANTTSISTKELGTDASLQFAPYIYQRRIQKTADIRVVIMGDEITAVSFSIELNPLGAHDIRLVPAEILRGEVVELDQAIVKQCKDLMRSLGLVFASIDLLKGLDGIITFLEVNSGGQFLWVESAVPESKMLSKFIFFLTSGETDSPIAINDVTKGGSFNKWAAEVTAARF